MTTDVATLAIEASPPTSVPEVFTRAEALARLRISENTLGRLIASGRLPVVRLGRRVFIRASDVEALLTPEAVRS